jgi:hypothetical protein
MTAEPVASVPQCEECRRVWLTQETDPWRCNLDADEDNLVFYCPDCADREFDDY